MWSRVQQNGTTFMTLTEAQQIIEGITYKIGTTVRIIRSYNTDIIQLGVGTIKPDVLTFKENPLINTITITPEYLVQMTEKDLIREIKYIIVRLELHEVDEWLKYKGVCVTNPHPTK